MAKKIPKLLSIVCNEKYSLVFVQVSCMVYFVAFNVVVREAACETLLSLGYHKHTQKLDWESIAHRHDCFKRILIFTDQKQPMQKQYNGNNTPLP